MSITRVRGGFICAKEKVRRIAVVGSSECFDDVDVRKAALLRHGQDRGRDFARPCVVLACEFSIWPPNSTGVV